jgi:IS30 family transposase
MKRSQLSIEEREKISYYQAQGKSSLEVGTLLKKIIRSISREIKRGKYKEDIYLPSQAQSLEPSRFNRCERKNKID